MSPFDVTNFGDYFIIESPIRGTFREWDHDEGKPRFSTSGARSDAEKCHRFPTATDAEEMLARFKPALQKHCQVKSAAEGFEPPGSTEYKYMVRGSFYEPSCEGANKDGYIVFFDIEIAKSEDEAKRMAAEDYGDYNHIAVHGIAKNKKEEDAWLAKNPD